MVSTTVSTKIVVEFDDQFTESANKSLENYKKNLEGVKRAQEDEYLKLLGGIFENLESVKPIDLQINTENFSKQIREIEELIGLFEGNNQLFLHLDLIDGATEDAIKIRKNLEANFNTPITQIINIKKINSGFGLSRSSDLSSIENDRNNSSDVLSSGSSDSVGIDGSSIRPGGFDTFGSLKGFSTGIDRVPRDMLAVIHKDEAVLTKNQAEERRQGNSSGVTIQSVNINMNVPDSFNPLNMNRQKFRQLAVQMHDELRRLDRRRSK